MLYHLPSVVRRPAVGIKVRLPVAGVQIGVGNRISTVQHHIVAPHRCPHGRYRWCHRCPQRTPGRPAGGRRPAWRCYRAPGRPAAGVAQAGIGQHIADEAGTVKGGLRAAPAPDIRVSQVFLRLGDEGGEPLIRQILGGDVPGRRRILDVFAHIPGGREQVRPVAQGGTYTRRTWRAGPRP